ncbi:2-dehydro-3-deoxy-6-phosphogalactonate aldolase [Arhodomonas aquaeolei]|uniref:2-dehydro-3-deoxy-6-phosphogalactonate aldolase n=1 Tax=Arhodomonas aquaeolei TaxID=2369 RepID=UPI002166D263|nr:2-dehydro-3-deoxy-6-phosphogalactonate aldolase [Arhodomonas aquaeolei]MCS4504817.1 2-dehydro-3-deoxy-6-phosphogalactonate aldolase [Arhodomonas aquaeolei]
MDPRFQDALAERPLVAILRGITPDECESIADALIDAGFGMLEVTLNSPQPWESLHRLRAHCPAETLVGAGTVLDAGSVTRLASMALPLMVTPNTDPAVIDAAAGEDMTSLIGCMTPTEALLAARHGASALKLFPAARLGPGYLRDVRAVLPPALPVLVVGGVNAHNLADFHAAGAAGYGIGGDVYRAGRPAVEVGAAARDIVAEYRRVRGGGQ